MEWGDESSFTEWEWTILKIHDRYDHSTRALGFGSNIRAICRILALQDSPTTITELAHRLHISRAAVRAIVGRIVGYGLFARDERGVHLTREGLGLFTRIHRETLQITIGNRVGYSAELVRQSRQHNLMDDGNKALKISFPIIKPFERDT